MDALIMHVIFDQAIYTYKPSNNICGEEEETTQILFFLYPRQTNYKANLLNAEDIPTSCITMLRIYSDNSTTICLGGPKYLHMGLSERNLVPLKRCMQWGRVSPLCVKVGYLSTS